MLKVSCCYKAKDGSVGKHNKFYYQNHHPCQLNTALVVPIYQNQIFEYKQYILLRNSFCGVFYSWSMDIQNPHLTFPYTVPIHWHI